MLAISLPPRALPPPRCTPSVFSYSAAISACDKCGGRADQALAIFGQMEAAGVAPNDVTYNALISTLGGAGRADEAVALLGTMEEAGVRPGVVSLNAAILACARQAEGGGDKAAQAVSLLRGMRGRGLTPNARSYNAALSACARVGDWRTAETLLEDMAAGGVRVRVRLGLGFG